MSLHVVESDRRGGIGDTNENEKYLLAFVVVLLLRVELFLIL